MRTNGTGDNVKDDAQRKTDKAIIHMRNSISTADDAYLRKTDGRTREEDAAGAGSGNVVMRPKKTKALVAVTRAIELSEEESTVTLMSRFLGANFFQAWVRHRQLLTRINLLGTALHFVTGYFLLLCDAKGTTKLLVYWGVAFPCVVSLAFEVGSIMNLTLIRQCLSMFDTWWFLTETLLLTVTLPFALCLESWAIFYSANLFFGVCAAFLFYDSLPVAARKSVRIPLLISSFFFLSQFSIIYAELSPNMCYYRFDTSDGLVLGAATCPGSRLRAQRKPWSIQLFDFCINRFITLTILTFKFTFFAFKNPEDCVLIRSRVRLVETLVLDEKTHQEQEASAQAAAAPGPGASRERKGIRRIRPAAEEAGVGAGTATNDERDSVVPEAPMKVVSIDSSSRDQAAPSLAPMQGSSLEEKLVGGPSGHHGQQKQTKRGSQATTPNNPLKGDNAHATIIDKAAEHLHHPGGETSKVEVANGVSRTVVARAEKKKTIVATTQHRQLTVEESQTTLMIWLFGKHFATRWLKQKKLLRVLSTSSFFALHVVLIIGTYGLEDKTMEILCLTLLLPSTLYLCLHNSSMMNRFIVKECLTMFDTRWVLLEATLFSASLPIVFCQRGHWTIISSSCTLLGICAGYLFYDSLPLAARKAFRFSLTISAFFYIYILTTLYSGTPRDMCYYRFRLDETGHITATQGIQTPDSTIESGFEDPTSSDSCGQASGTGSSFSLTLSVFDFSLNRLSTLTILTLKIMVSALRHPADCVLVKSRMRLIEGTP